MGKNLEKIKNVAKSVPAAVENFEKKAQHLKDTGKLKKDPKINEKKFTKDKKRIETPVDLENNEDENFQDENEENFFDDGEVGIREAQRPESFHHFILENQYKDLEKSIRGYKDVFDKESQSWKTKRKKLHCFTDDEAEDILRMAQSHLATDIKLGRIKSEVFGNMMDAIYKEVAFLFESIAEYRYGRYGDYNKQYNMKAQNQKIFLELFSRIQSNYSRAIDGGENIATHGSVRGQESLKSGERDFTGGGNGEYS